ncbi:MAG: hypothetical protein GX286_05820 [Clostridiales bacterium]|jgi:hypothetical protein|nr:hypothetical protein [Clostridiales bacterium]
MADKRRPLLNRYPVTPNYLAARADAIAFEATEIKKMVPQDNEVYGLVIDLPMGPNLLSTLVCYANGAANIYYNNGGSLLGTSMKYRPVAHAARLLVLSAENCLADAEKVNSYDLPMGRMHYVYFLTKKGFIYRTVITPNNFNEEDKGRKLLFHLYQNVLAEIRIAQLKEEGEKGKGNS